MQAESFSVEVGGLEVGVQSEGPALRRLLASSTRLTLRDGYVEPGMLLGRPGSDKPTASPLWVAYESGDIVMRRTKTEADVALAATLQLLAIEHALTSGLLAMRFRTVVLESGELILVHPSALSSMAGYDRRLEARGGLVLCPTIVAIDPPTGEVHFVSQDLDARQPVGCREVKAVLLGDGDDPERVDSYRMIGLARSAVRYPSSNLDQILSQIEELEQSWREKIELLQPDGFSSRLDQLVLAPRDDG